MKQIQTGQPTCPKTGQVYLLLTETLTETKKNMALRRVYWLRDAIMVRIH